ncbi:hypothetical protein ACFXGE_10760, partial [Streptomyces sp. NPDC059378]
QPRAPTPAPLAAPSPAPSRLGVFHRGWARPAPHPVRLDRAATTRSGLRWSSSDGPPYVLTSMTLATASIRLADRRPVDWLLP